MNYDQYGQNVRRYLYSSSDQDESRLETEDENTCDFCRPLEEHENIFPPRMVGNCSNEIHQLSELNEVCN